MFLDWLSRLSFIPTSLLSPSPSILDIPTSPTDNDQSTLDTIVQMKQLVSESIANPQFIAYLDNVVLGNFRVPNNLGVPASQAYEKSLIRFLFYWVRNNVKYVEDEDLLVNKLGYDQSQIDKDLLISPEVIVQMHPPQGDCDDSSMLLAAFLVAKQIKCTFVTIKADSFQPWRYSHVYVRAYMKDGSSLYLDPSFGGYPGWETGKTIYAKTEWSIN